MSVVSLDYTAPFDWAGMLAFLGPRATAGIETVEGDAYRRTVEIEGHAGAIHGTWTRAGVTHLFPRAETLAEADVARIGMPRARASTIRALSRAVADGALTLDTSVHLEDAIARLCAIPGIGPWTAHYVALRGLGLRDAF